MNDIMRVVNVHRSYLNGAEELKVLKGVNLIIKKGEILAVTGVSGSGKSTLLHLLGLIDKPIQGEIFFEGRATSEYSDDELADLRNKKIGFIFQFHNLLGEFSAVENVVIPGLIRGVKRREVVEKAEILLRKVGLEERMNCRPPQLSCGEQQRVAIARALVNDPDLVLADEPTGNLDSATSFQVFDILRELVYGKGVALVVATHDERLALLSDRVVRLLDGKVVEVSKEEEKRNVV
jgi:lipoprotein-releasing system ATP-binding protein